MSEGPNDLEFAKALGVPTVYSGWRAAQLNVEQEDLAALGTTAETHRDFTLAFIYAAREAGAKSAVCLESGQNDDPQSAEIAYRAIRNSLAFHGLTNETSLPFPVTEPKELIRFDRVLIRRDTSEHLVDIDRDTQPVSGGQVILKGASREITAPQGPGNWIVAHPIPNAAVGQHIGFLAQRL